MKKVDAKINKFLRQLIASAHPHFRLGHFRLATSGWPFQVGPFQVEFWPFQVGAISGWAISG